MNTTRALWIRQVRRATTVVTVMSVVGMGSAVATSVAIAAGTRTVLVPKHVCKAHVKLHYATCFAERLVRKTVSAADAANYPSARGMRPAYATGPANGFTPADIAMAYGANVNGGGTQTVAIVDAFGDSHIAGDLAAFDANYGLRAETARSFKVVNQSGLATPLPADNAGWALETALDVEIVRGLCHHCKIVLVEGTTNSFNNLATAENTAAALGATEISNSYGGVETGITGANAAAYNHPKVVITASTGDDGWYGWDHVNVGGSSDNMPSAPASLNTVVAVGGTSLYLNDNGTRLEEDVWNNNGPHDYDGYFLGETGASGGGCSLINNATNWQHHVIGNVTLGCGAKRMTGDVAAVADPFTGFDVYSTLGASGWETIGGTSLSAPVIAALWADAGGSGGVPNPSLSLYGHYQSSPSTLHDITFGGTGACDTANPAACAHFFGGNPNKFGAGMLDCAFDNTASTTPLPNRYQCYARFGFDGPSGVGTPGGPTVFKPMNPTVKFTVPGTITHGVSAQFDATTSSDPFPGGVITKYTWQWGDGTADTVSTTPVVHHTFATAGASTGVTLTIADNYGRGNSDGHGISVG
jgi:hypothetical protein